MPDIGVNCTWTNLDGNGFNLNSAEGRPLVPFLALTKLLATFAWSLRKGNGFLVDQLIVYSCDAKTKH